MGGRGKSWEMPFVETFDLLGSRFRRSGKGVQGTEQRMGSWWRDGHICRAKSVSQKSKCDRVSHVFGTALNGSAYWPWMERSGIKDPETDVQTKNEGGRRMGYKKTTSWK